MMAVVLVSAINVNKLKVEFNKEVDTEKATFEVKRGTVTETVKVTWNEEKTEATLERTAGNFVAGEYTVTVAGVELAEGANSGKATVEAEKVESVVINTGSLQKTATAPVSIDFINQYGEKAKVVGTDSKLTLAAYNTTKGESIPRVANKFELDVASTSAVAGDKVNINVLYNGISATKEVTVVNAATVGNVTLGEVVLPEGKTMFTPAGTKNVEVKYTATNTLGEEYKLTAGDVGTSSSSAVKKISSDSAILDVADVTIDANNKIHIAKFKKAGTVKLTFMATATGNVSSVEIEVKENAGEPYAVTLEKNAVEFAAGSITPFHVGMTVTDKYGTEIAAKDLKTADYEVSVDNSSVVNAAAFETTVGDNYGKVKVTPASTTKGNSAVVTVLVKATGQKATFTVTASDAAVPTSIDTEKDTTVVTNLLVGATQTIKLDTKDQYGTVLGATTGYTVDYTTSDATVLSITSAETGDALGSEQVSVKALKAGTSVLKAQLKKDGVAVAEKAYTITVIANDSTKVTYEVAPIDNVYKLGVTAVKTIDNDSAANHKKAAVESGYAEEVVLQAKDANGNTTLVPTSAVVGTPSITLPKQKDGSTAMDGALEWFEYEGKYYVVTKTDFTTADFATETGSADITAKISFTINAEDTVKLVSQNITISKDNLVAQSVEFKSDKPGVKTATDVTELTLANLSEYGTTGKTAYVWTKDQFGGYVLSDDDDSTGGTKTSLFAVSGADSAKVAKDKVAFAEADGTITITDTDSDKATTFTANNAKIRIIATSGSKTDFITVTVTDGVAPTKAATNDFVVDASDNKIATIKFSEKIKVSSIAAGDFSVTGGSANLGDATALVAVDEDAEGYATTFTITAAGASASGFNTGSQLKVDATKVVDQAGNAAGASGTVDFTAVQ